MSLFIAVPFLLAVLLLAFPMNHVGATSSSTPLFLPVVTYDSLGRGSASVAVADLNGDSKPDLVVASILGGPLSVLLGNGDGIFQPAVGVGNAGFSVAVADLNGDGKPDLVVTDLGLVGTVEVMLGNGDGSFQPAVAYDSGGAYSSSVAVADVNGDGKPDLVVTNEEGQFFGGLVDVLLGHGDGTFQPPVTYGSGGGDAWSVAVVDVNGDGDPDLIIANVCSRTSCSTHGVVSVLLNNGDGTFQTAMAYDSGGFDAFSVAVADVNGDGKSDIAVVNVRSDNVGMLIGNGDGTFQPAVTYARHGILGDGPESVAIADLNGDGKPDLMVAYCNSSGGSCGLTHGLVGVLLGNGDGTFQAAVTYTSGGFDAWAVVAADVDRDGRPDLVVANYCGKTYCTNGSVGVLLNNTSFCTTPPVITVSTSAASLWPPNGRMVPVAISGTITDEGCTVKTAAYAVKDEYGDVQPSGPVTTGTAGAYSFMVLLQASRLGADPDGRLYTITVSASNDVGNTGSEAGAVIVPHDHGR
jgi:hypothetical protein